MLILRLYYCVLSPVVSWMDRLSVARGFQHYVTIVPRSVALASLLYISIYIYICYEAEIFYINFKICFVFMECGNIFKFGSCTLYMSMFSVFGNMMTLIAFPMHCLTVTLI